MLRTALSAALLLALTSTAGAASFTYRGQLEDAGAPAQGTYRLELRLYADAQGRIPLAQPVVVDEVAVNDGRFAVAVDFPNVPDHVQSGWLEVAVQSPDDASFWPLPDRQAVTLKGQSCPNAWSLSGNPGTSPALNFLGTTDNQALELRTRNARSLRIEPSTVLFGTPALPITTNTIGGSHANHVTAGVRGATIAGGGVPIGNSDPQLSFEAPNSVTDSYGTVSGGYNNQAGDGGGTTLNAAFATVGGGFNNRASSQAATVGGGESNEASSARTTVAGGFGNFASALGSTVGGGLLNVASGAFSTVVGGGNNTASRSGATVGGGENNCAGARRSWAGGFRAKVRPGSASGSAGTGCDGVPVNAASAEGDFGTFVWADDREENVVSSGQNQFLVRAGGGVMFNTNALTFPSDDLVIGTRPDAADPDVDLAMVTRSGSRMRIYTRNINGQLVIHPLDLGSGAARIEVNGPGGTASLSNGGTWTNASSRDYKHAVSELDTRAVLDRLLTLPITRWEYVGSSEGSHIGPFAEDFRDAFDLAGDGRSIATVDADGIALASIQGLNAKLEAEIAHVTARNEALASDNQALAERLALLAQTQAEELSALRDELARLSQLMAPAIAGVR